MALVAIGAGSADDRGTAIGRLFGSLARARPEGYGEIGFQPTGILFAGPGCWEVTGRVGDASLTFVTLVVRMGEGPASRCSVTFGGFRSNVP